MGTHQTKKAKKKIGFICWCVAAGKSKRKNSDAMIYFENKKKNEKKGQATQISRLDLVANLFSFQ